MKTLRIKYLSGIAVLVMAMTACSDYVPGQEPVDSSAPGMVTDVKIENIPGGAILTYKLPTDEDLLYIRARYRLTNGSISEVKSSLYVDTICIEGLGDTIPHMVELTSVDRSRNESQSVNVEIHPLTPPVLTVARSLKMRATAGGVIATWRNPDKAQLKLYIDLQDSLSNWVNSDVFYSQTAIGKGALYGQKAKPQFYRMHVEDRWGNTSPFLVQQLTPVFSQEFDKELFKAARLPGDVKDWGGWEIQYMWDGRYGQDVTPGYSTDPVGLPQTTTFNLGCRGVLHRITLFQREGWQFLFHEGNVREFEVYGATQEQWTQSRRTEREGVPDLTNWTFLGHYNSVKPSGLPLGQSNQDDANQAWVTGESFDIDDVLDDGTPAPAIQYIRLRVLRSWSGGPNFQIGEISVFGNYEDYN